MRVKQSATKVILAAFALLALVIWGVMGYVAFVVLPREDAPWILVWFFRAVILSMVLVPLGDALWKKLKRRKGVIRIRLERDSYPLGDAVRGTALMRVRSKTLIHQVDAELVGFTEYRRQLQPGSPMKFEEVHFRRTRTIDFKKEAGAAEYSAHIEFSTDDPELETWVFVNSRVRWYVRVILKCRGLDLESHRYFDLFSPDEFPESEELLNSG